MRILVLADIHANWPALAAIQEPFDACLFVGDLVDYATEPIPCVEWVRQHATVAVRGNHDHAVAQRIPVKKESGLHRLAAATRPLHWKVLSPLQLKYLTRLPVTRHVTLDDRRFYLVHATPRDPFDEYLRDDQEAWSVRLESIEADFVLVGHTHIPLCLQLERTLVINPGSVGQPRDGDPRCAYAIIDNGRVELRRIKYNIDATIKHMRDTGIDADTLALAEAVLKSGGQMDPADLERWTRRLSAPLVDVRNLAAPGSLDKSQFAEPSNIAETSTRDTAILDILSANTDPDSPTEELRIPQDWTDRPDAADTTTLKVPFTPEVP